MGMRLGAANRGVSWGGEVENGVNDAFCVDEGVQWLDAANPAM